MKQQGLRAPTADGLVAAFVQGIKETPAGYFRPVVLVASWVKKMFVYLHGRLPTPPST